MDKIDLHQGMMLPQVFYTEWKHYQDQIKQAIYKCLKRHQDMETI